MDQTLITVLRYSITYYQKDLFICAQYANKHKTTALHKAYWLPCWELSLAIFTILFGIAPKLRNMHFITDCGDHHIYYVCLLTSMKMLLY